jgi:hypothetical protein
MKLVIRTVVFHTLCIVIFTYLYLYLSNHFQNEKEDFNNTKQKSFIDFLLLSTTIQAGVGFSNLFPISYYGKIAVIVQQIITILTHVITLYIFTL